MCTADSQHSFELWQRTACCTAGLEFTEVAEFARTITVAEDAAPAGDGTADMDEDTAPVGGAAAPPSAAVDSSHGAAAAANAATAAAEPSAEGAAHPGEWGAWAPASTGDREAPPAVVSEAEPTAASSKTDRSKCLVGCTSAFIVRRMACNGPFR